MDFSANDRGPPAVRSTSPSPQVLANKPVIEDGFASRSLDGFCVVAAAPCGNPRKLLKRAFDRERGAIARGDEKDVKSAS